MKLFFGIPPNNGHHSIKAGLKALLLRARSQGSNEIAQWRLSQLELDREDQLWLDAWAQHLNSQVLAFWLQVDQTEVEQNCQLNYATGIGSLLLLVATEYARRGLPQSEGWATPIAQYFSAEARVLLYSGDDPSPTHLRTLKLAAQRLRLQCGRAENLKGWLRETIALQVGNTGEPNKDYPRWIPETIQQLEDAHSKLQTPNVETTSHSTKFPIDLLTSVKLRPGANVIVEAVEVILQRAAQRRLMPLPWSLTELGSTDQDFHWLCKWSKQLDVDTLTYCQSPFRWFPALGRHYQYSAALGLLLLFWIVEHARRRAEEGTLWRWIPQADLPPAVRTRLFNNGQPTQALKELLELAARRFRLRHVFGFVGAQQWLDTVFLQFGFTQRGYERRLPEWLAGQTTPQALQRLLDPQTGSLSFQEGWEALRSFRRNEITATRARQQFDENPWFLKEWIEPMLHLAQASIQTNSLSISDTTEEVPMAFLSPPAFAWEPPHPPYFSCRLIDLDAFELHEDSYELRVGPDTHTRILRQPNGSYAEATPSEIRVPLRSSTVTVQLVGRSGQVAASAELEFWQAGEEVTIFQLTNGKRLADAFNDELNALSAYALFLAEDLTVTPPLTHWLSVAGMKLYLLPRGWEKTTRVWLDGDLLWEPVVKEKGKPVEPEWSRQVFAPTLSTKAMQWGEIASLEVIHPPGVTVRFIRGGGQPLDFQSRSDRRTSFRLKILPAWSANRVPLKIGLRYGDQQQTVQRIVELPIVGAKKYKEGRWHALSDRYVLNLPKTTEHRFAISPPREWEGTERTLNEWALMEGDNWVRRLGPRPLVLGALTGLGAPLTVRLGPYNAASDALTVAQQVIDTGLLLRAESREDLLILHLFKPLEPSPSHRVWYWDVQGGLHELTPVAQQPSEWRCALSADLPDFIAVAVAYEGSRLGVWWQPEWSRQVVNLSTAAPLQTALRLRWWRLPLLAPNALPEVRAAAAQHPATYLRAWLCDNAEMDSLHVGALTDGWMAAARTVFQGLSWQATQTVELIEQLSAETLTAGTPLEQAAWKLLNFDPLLLARVLSGWLMQQTNRQVAQQSLYALRLKLAEIQHASDLSRQTQQLLAESAQVWGVDEYFIRTILERAQESLKGLHLSRRDEMNLSLAVTLEPLRRLLALHLLDVLLKEG